jgi:DNA-formamidopyrimidine glycosylase
MTATGNDKIILCHLKMTGQLIWEAYAGETEFCLKKRTGLSTELSFESEPDGSSFRVEDRATTQRVVGGYPSADCLPAEAKAQAGVNKLPSAYTRAIIHFDDDSVLFFNDLRRFGYMKLYDSKDLSEIAELKKLGPEPFSDKFTVDYLMRRATKIPNRKIKQFITDQEIISGVGNIYVDEALFYAGILPTRLVKEIKLSEWQKIRESILKALELGIKYGGSSEDTYVDAFGNQGTMSEHTKVYRRTGQACQREGCEGIVKRITLGGRGTHFCPECQK